MRSASQKPDRLSMTEDDWMSYSLVYFASKRFSVMGAYADMGEITGAPSQQGVYLSLQLTL